MAWGTQECLLRRDQAAVQGPDGHFCQKHRLRRAVQTGDFFGVRELRTPPSDRADAERAPSEP